MLLFDPGDVDPTRTGARDHNEGEIDFLRVSAMPEAEDCRQLLESWFADYPDEHQHELKQRIYTSGEEFNSPFFELTLYSTFRKMGSKVEVHPLVGEAIANRPDFRIILPTGFEFYLEAVLSTGQSDEERARENAIKAIYSVIDRRLRSPEFFWSVQVQTQGPSQPSAKALVNDLYLYSQTLKHEEVVSAFQEHGFETPNRFRWEDSGWQIDLIPIPKSPQSFHKAHRPLGFFPGKLQFMETDREIRDAVTYKIAHHSDLNLPYVVAVNATKFGAHSEDFISAVYGSDQVTVTTFADGSHSMQNTRARDGVWLDAKSTRNDHVFAVIGANNLRPWSVRNSELVVYENPYIPVDALRDLSPLPAWRGVEGTLKRFEGQGLAAIFGLDQGEQTYFVSDLDDSPD